jgi:hypothetical protein
MDRQPNIREMVTLGDLAREKLSPALLEACGNANLSGPCIHIRVTRGWKISFEVTPLGYPKEKPIAPAKDSRN